MSWPLYIVERFERESDPFIDSNGRAHTAAYRLADGSLKSLPELKVGSMWRGAIPNSWHIKFPGHGGNVSWNPWSGGSSGAKWNISGEAPTLTLTPSINHVGVYHGWITNGVITDDCEGRKFDDFGTEIK